MPDFFEDDSEIRQFQEEYPDVYAGLMRIIKRGYRDEAVR